MAQIMYEDFAIPVVKAVLGKLGSLATQEILDVWGLKNELEKFKSTFCQIQGVLKDAEVKQRTSEDIRYWLSELKDVAYETEDVLDEISTEDLRRTMYEKTGRSQIRCFFFLQPFCDLIFKFTITMKVKSIKKKLDAINENRRNYHLKNETIGETSKNRETSSLVDDSKTYGRSEERDVIVKKILGNMQNPPDDLSVYALCGMGGIGKTTLAQLVYNDERVKAHFHLHIWVCVSNDFSVQRLAKLIIESIKKDQCTISSLDELLKDLREKLSGKRFLLVLDDVWSEESDGWDKLKVALKCGSKGSVVIVTTRIENVAIMMGSFHTHRLQHLSEDESWTLFRQIAFADNEGGLNLEGIGKEIVRKCKGLPLAVKALGRLMRCKSSEREWLDIQKSEIWQLNEKNGIIPALRLSYYDLPPPERQCFTYCCIFPKDHKMEKNDLIQLWMANGFISSKGHSIFQELLWRSFFQDVEEDWEGNTTCKMHDMMHDLAQSVMKHETFIEEGRKVLENPKMVRHLMTLCSWTSIMHKLPIGVSLRSLIIDKQEDSDDDEGISSFLSKQQSLRVLKLNIHLRHRLSQDVFSMLERLRYLELSCSGIKSLPESVIFLLNLQTLKLTNSRELCELPKDLKYLKNLQFLDIDDFRSLDSTPPDLGELKFLQRLSIFIVGEASSHQIHQLKELDLEGRLTIKGLENVRNFEDANLKSKKNLTDLELSWNPMAFKKEGQFDEVLEGLQPHQNLKNLTIFNFPGSRFPDGFQNLSSLTELRIWNCEGLLSLPDWLGNLSSLTYLHIENCPKLESLPESIQQLSALETLWLEDCEGLLSLPDGFQNLSSLIYLDIRNCPHLTQRCQKPNGEDWWKIRHIPNISIED